MSCGGWHRLQERRRHSTAECCQATHYDGSSIAVRYAKQTHKLTMQRDYRLGTRPQRTRHRNLWDFVMFLIPSGFLCLIYLEYVRPTCLQFRSAALRIFATRHTTNKPVGEQRLLQRLKFMSNLKKDAYRQAPWRAFFTHL